MESCESVVFHCDQDVLMRNRKSPCASKSYTLSHTTHGGLVNVSSRLFFQNFKMPTEMEREL